MEEVNTNVETQKEDTTVAVLSYITLIGFIVAIVMHGNNKTKLGAYHLRQSLGLIITAVAFYIAVFIIAFIPFVNLLLVILTPLAGLGFLILVILGIVNAANGQQKPLPLVGKMFESKLASAFQ